MTTDWPDLAIYPLAATILIAAAALPAAHADWPPPSFEAHYEVLMDGKRRLETAVRFERQGPDWQLQSRSEGVKGLARFIGAETNESAAGTWADGQLRTRSFEHRAKFALSERHWTARFDWDARTVATRHGDGEAQLDLAPGTVDPVALTLQLAAHLERGEHGWTLPVLDEDEIDLHRYTAKELKPVQTPLGCFDAVEVVRVREDSDRYSSVWLAPALGWISVRVAHGKQDGREFVMRLETLNLDGETIERREDCE